ncbi:MAG: hypothetical protein U0797_22980 [Gemmataceae bacterium]
MSCCLAQTPSRSSRTAELVSLDIAVDAGDGRVHAEQQRRAPLLADASAWASRQTCVGMPGANSSQKPG